MYGYVSGGCKRSGRIVKLVDDELTWDSLAKSMHAKICYYCSMEFPTRNSKALHFLVASHTLKILKSILPFVSRCVKASISVGDNSKCQTEEGQLLRRTKVQFLQPRGDFLQLPHSTALWRSAMIYRIPPKQKRPGCLMGILAV